ncbi:MAG: MBL fold metallo-hydrolase [Bacteroidales bacterium]|nr:MBL fold metallo-hydrolase [Bacteroidales bacterium]
MIKQFTFNHYEVNCYVVSDDRVPTEGEKRQCAIVDPACEASFEDSQLLQYIEAEGLTVRHILLTHAHVDHIAGLRQCCEHFGLPVTMHKDGRKLLRQAEAYGSIMGFAVDDMSDLDVVELNDGDVIELGDLYVECRYVPGHCPGSMCFVVTTHSSVSPYRAASSPTPAVITGDALFHFSIGRTDLPGGSYPLLIEKIKTRIMTLPDDYTVLPGHGIASSIGKERKYNSFLA